LGESKQAPVRKSIAPQRIYVQTEEENDADVARAYADVPDDSAGDDRRAHQQKTAEDQCDSDPAVGARRHQRLLKTLSIIDQVQLKNINPPEPVQASFNEVNQAQQEKEKLINEARRDYNKVIPLADGEKDQRIREADGYRLKRVNEAQGDAARFTALLAEYIKAPVVTRRRIYIETLQDVMPGVRSKIIVDERTRSILPFLNLDSPKGDRP